MSSPGNKKPGSLSFSIGIKTKKHVNLTVQQRLDILRRLDEGVPLHQLAKQNKVSIVTVRRIHRNAYEIQQHSEWPEREIRKRIRKPYLDDLDTRLYAWVMEERSKGKRITDIRLQEKAKEFNARHGGPSSFTASRGWTWRFKVRHNISVVKTRPKRVSKDDKKTKEFTEKLLRHMEEEDVEVQNVYTIEEVGIMWKALPPRISGFVGDKKSQKNKAQKGSLVSVGFCVNATGMHKLPLLFVHKLTRPKALKHCWDQLPVVFRSQKYGTIADRELFIDWLENHFKPAVRKEQLERGYAVGTVLLLVDRYLFDIIPKEIRKTHKFEMVPYPLEPPSLLQPIHQGVASYVKKSFRHLLMQRIGNHSNNVKKFFEDYDMKDCIDMINDAWTDVTNTLVRNAWQKIFPDQEEESPVDDSSGFDKTLAIRDILCRIVRDDIRLEEIEEWLSCEEAEEDLIIHTMDSEEKQDLPLLDKEHLNRTFRNLLVWAKKQSECIKLDAHMLANYYN